MDMTAPALDAAAYVGMDDGRVQVRIGARRAYA